MRCVIFHPINIAYLENLLTCELFVFDQAGNAYYRKIRCLTSEFHVKFHARNRYRTNREAMSVISVFQVKFNVEFTRQAIFLESHS